MSVARGIALLAALAMVGCGSAASPGGSTTSRTSARNTATATGTATARARPAAPAALVPRGPGALAVMAPKRGLTLRNRPRGSVVAHLRPKTAWGSPTVVWAVRRRGAWLGVVATALANNRIGWIDVGHDHPRMWRSPFALVADLSQRVLLLRRDGRIVRRMPIAIGSASTPTPTGRFSVTDKLVPDRGVAYYGCCVLALSGHQPHLRPGWAGGNRIAIHGGRDIGSAASAGCLHLGDADLRHLMRILPVGTPVVIRA